MKILNLFVIVILLILNLNCSQKTTEPEDQGNNNQPQPTTGTFTGRVRDANTSQFIEGVTVRIAGRADVTDYVGQYWIDYVPVGNKDYTASKSGYDTYLGSIEIIGGESVGKHIYLTPTAPVKKTITIFVSEDAYTSTGNLTTNYGTENSINTGNIDYGGSGGPHYFRGYLKFDISSIPSGASIDKAVLILNTGLNNVLYVDTAITTLSRVKDKNWYENSITYFNSPSIFSAILTKTVYFGNFSEPQNWTVTSTVQGWYENSISNYGFSINSSIDNGSCYFYSKEVSQGAGARLIVDYYE